MSGAILALPPHSENASCSCGTILGRLWDRFAAQKQMCGVALDDGAVVIALVGRLAMTISSTIAPLQADTSRRPSTVPIP